MSKEFLVNKNIKRIIESGDKRINEVAAKAGIGSKVFSNIIRCRRSVYADEVVRIADALGVPLEVLFAVIPD